jgi:hypothetical protein
MPARGAHLLTLAPDPFERLGRGRDHRRRQAGDRLFEPGPFRDRKLARLRPSARGSDDEAALGFRIATEAEGELAAGPDAHGCAIEAQPRAGLGPAGDEAALRHLPDEGERLCPAPGGEAEGAAEDEATADHRRLP